MAPGTCISQHYQEEILKKYCQVNNIRVRKVVFEDYSAKNFNRPEWNRLLSSFKRKDDRPTYILFTKWDRFSRNVGDAYYMIAQLHNMGIEVRAIEQSIDLSIPENKMMMSFYLTIPEVENDRRSLNVQQGMRRAKKEGRWMGIAPIGYANKTYPDGTKYITPTEPEASFMQRAFEELAKGKLNVRQIHKKALENGLQCSLANFWQVIRNPIYCGRILLRKTAHESQQIVVGIHTPIISEQLFLKAQAFLDSRRTARTKTIPADHLPLRGYINCPKCQGILSGSQSKGHSKRYWYYHCLSGCGYRVRADLVNKIFEGALKDLVLRPPYSQKIAEILGHTVKSTLQQNNNDLLKTSKQIENFIKRINAAKELLLQGHITGDDYKAIKIQCETKISLLGSTMADLQTSRLTIDKDISNTYDLLKHVDTLYQLLPLSQKKELTEILFTLPLTFVGKQFQHLYLSDPAREIYSEDPHRLSADTLTAGVHSFLTKLAELAVASKLP